MRRFLAVVLLSGLVTGCRAKREAWPKSAGTKPFREQDAGQSLAPQAPVMEAVENGGASPAKAAKAGHGKPIDATSAPAVAPAAPVSPPPGDAEADAIKIEAEK